MTRRQAGVAALVVVGLALGLGVVFVRIFVIGVSIVPQNGMYPTIPRGSLVLSWQAPYDQVSDVERGDIVLFNRVQDGHTYLYIWRVVGLPGDHVVASGSALAINGVSVARARVRSEEKQTIFAETIGQASYEIAIGDRPEHTPPEMDVVVGPSELLVLGDNRYNAVDSRYFGAIPFSSVVGRTIW